MKPCVSGSHRRLSHGPAHQREARVTPTRMGELGGDTSAVWPLLWHQPCSWLTLWTQARDAERTASQMPIGKRVGHRAPGR